MRKWITSIISPTSVDATAQSKDDITKIAEQNGYLPLQIFRYDSSTESDEAMHARIDGITAGVAQGDIVVYQYPVLLTLRFEELFIAHMHARDVKTVVLIHDVEMLRGTQQGVYPDEIAYFNYADALIVHNPIMEKKLRELGVTTPMVSQYLLDFLDDDHTHNRLFTAPEDFTKMLVFSGNLAKSTFLTNWHQQTPITVFGMGDNQTINALLRNPKVDYRGVFERYELINRLPKGFGLAWDSDSANAGYGQYTKYNHPHKASLYLAHGLPVIVWRHSALAKFVQENHLGVAVNSLDEIDTFIHSVSADHVVDLLNHVNRFGVLLRDGYFTARALLMAEQEVLVGHISFR